MCLFEGRLQSMLSIRLVVFQASTRSYSSRVKMPDCHFQPKPYKGASYEDAVKARKLYVNPGLTTAFNKPLLVHQGHMQWVWDHTGKRYLDMAAGIVTISVGHCHPKLVKAMGDQNLTLWHSPSIFLNPATTEYVEKLAAKMPGDLKAVYLTNSGTEANDLAIYMTRLYTGRFDILSLQNAYHGNSPHLMGTTAMSTWRHNVPSGFGMHQFMVPDVYRGPWGGSRCRDSPVQTTRTCSCQEGKCEANEKYLEQLDNVLKFSLPKVGLAGAIIESIQGAGGAVQFPKEFVKRAFELIRSKGGLCISDEVQTGFGRTGTHFWGFEGHGVVPDMVTMAKGIGNGFPLAAVITTHEIAKPLSTALHFNTFGGDPLACVAGSAVLDVLEEDKLQENAKVVGTYLLEELAKLREENKFVGDVRGKGLMIGVELVKNKETLEPLKLETVNGILNDCLETGVILVKGGIYGNVLRIKPPLCITKEDVDFALHVIRGALDKNIK